MTDGHGETFGTGPGGLLVPGDLDFEGDHEDRVPDPGNFEDRQLLLRSLHRLEDGIGRMEGLLKAHAAGRREEFERVRAKLLEVTVGLARVRDVPEDLARKFDVEDVLTNQRHEFSYLRECLAWLRGAATAGTPGPAPRSGRSAGGAIALVASGGVSGFLLCAVLAVAFGLVDGNGLRGIRTPEPASVSGDRRQAYEPDRYPPFGSRDLNPSQGIVGAPAGVNPWYSREAEHVDERRVREAVDVMPVFERPRVAAPPDLEEGGKTVRGRRGPEEYLGRREDRIQLHPDVLTDGAP